MKTTLKKIANLFLIFVMVIAVSSVIADPLPITGDHDLLAGGRTGTIDQPLPITGDHDLLAASGSTETIDQPLPITGDHDLLSDGTTFFTLIYINGTPVLIPIVL
jgi:hypothetical protein